MYRQNGTFAALAILSSAALGQGADPAGAPDQKSNANPCRDEVSAALQKLRRSSWFRMETSMITENGPTKMTVDYVLPDRMHQRVQVVGQEAVQETILVGKKAWSNEGGGWHDLDEQIANQIVAQVQETVLDQQTDVGNYSCRGKVTLDGKEVFSYKLEHEQPKDSDGPKNEAFRMFYIDATTGLPVR
ncbi:MAG: hypothetical protein ACRCS9_08680, partial [Hyphomicrobium sp.]